MLGEKGRQDLATIGCWENLGVFFFSLFVSRTSHHLRAASVVCLFIGAHTLPSLGLMGRFKFSRSQFSRPGPESQGDRLEGGRVGIGRELFTGWVLFMADVDRPCFIKMGGKSLCRTLGVFPLHGGDIAATLLLVRDGALTMGRARPWIDRA